MPGINLADSLPLNGLNLQESSTWGHVALLQTLATAHRPIAGALPAMNPSVELYCTKNPVLLQAHKLQKFVVSDNPKLALRRPAERYLRAIGDLKTLEASQHRWREKLRLDSLPPDAF